MQEVDFNQALTDVSRAFPHPIAIVMSGDLTKDQKVALLNQWELDLRELLVASEEAMTATGSGRSAEELRSVREALLTLGAAESPDDKKSGPNKH